MAKNIYILLTVLSVVIGFILIFFSLLWQVYGVFGHGGSPDDSTTTGLWGIFFLIGGPLILAFGYSKLFKNKR